jgi:hypothetical protein
MATTNVCPECGGLWHEDLDEDGKPYTCFVCCNGTVKVFDIEPPPRIQKKDKVLKRVSRRSIFFED